MDYVYSKTNIVKIIKHFINRRRLKIWLMKNACERQIENKQYIYIT